MSGVVVILLAYVANYPLANYNISVSDLVVPFPIAPTDSDEDYEILVEGQRHQDEYRQ